VYLSGVGSRRCIPELADLPGRGASAPRCHGRIGHSQTETSDRRTGAIRQADGTHCPGQRPQPGSRSGSGRPARPTGRRALSGHPEHFALVVATPAAVFALASCRAVAGGTAELAVLVEDAHQRQGIGARLLKRLIEHADRSGLQTLRATLLAEQEWIVRPLRAYGTCTAVMSTGVLEVTVRRRADDRNKSSARGRAASIRQPRSVSRFLE
jgi:GNAT superfamily N-acetyltransferase